MSEYMYIYAFTTDELILRRKKRYKTVFDIERKYI